LKFGFVYKKLQKEMEAAFQGNEKKQKHSQHTDQIKDAKYTFQPMLD
jgi:hypothetical protein